MKCLLIALMVTASLPASAQTDGWVWKEVVVSANGLISNQGKAKVELSGSDHKALLLDEKGRVYATVVLKAEGDSWKATLVESAPKGSATVLDGREVERSTDDKCKSKDTAMMQEAFVLTNGWRTLHLMVAYCDT